MASVPDLAEAVSDLVFELDGDGKYRAANRRHSELLGLSPQALIGTSFFDRVHRRDLAAVRESILRADAAPVRLRLHKNDGSWMYLEATVLPQRTDSRQHVVLVARPVERLAAPHALRDSEDLFRGVLERLEQSVVIFDVERRMPVYHNPGYHHIFHMPRDASRRRAKEFLAHVHADDRENVARWMDEQFERPTIQSYRFLRDDGSLRWIRGGTSLIRAEDGRVIRMVSIVEDVTEEREAAMALRDREERFRSVAENIPGAVYLLALQDGPELIYLSDAIEDLTDVPADAFRSGQQPLLELLHPGDKDSYLAEIGSALMERRPILVLFRVRTNDGGWRWLEQRGRGVWNSDGELRLLGGAIFDVSERMRGDEERRDLQLQLFQAQKLESLGVLAGGVAHDFNNMMGIVTAGVELALLRLGSDHPSRALFEESLEATRKAAMLTKQLLAYAGHGIAEVQRVDLSEPVLATCRMLERSIGSKIRLDLDLPDDLPLVEIDLAQMQQVIMNLVINASEAIGQAEGVIRVRCGESQLSPERARLILGAEQREGDVLVFLEVEDDGAGMSPGVRARIFDPFYTTKAEGHGLGLAAVLGIVHAHRGGITVESERGIGTKFSVLIPVAERLSEAEELPAEDLRGEGRVLVVDDERVMRETACKVLSHYGYTTLEASNGREALDLVIQQASQIALVLLDLNMPGLTGYEVFPLIRKIRGDLPVILCSAFGELDAVGRLTREPATAFLAKPYGARDLALGIRALLRDCGS